MKEKLFEIFIAGLLVAVSVCFLIIDLNNWVIVLILWLAFFVLVINVIGVF